MYNFTKYDIGRHQAVCYCYDQTIASKGSNEVGSLLYHYFSERIAKGITKFESFADNCGGQNRNRFVMALFLHVTDMFPHISLTHTFLECGHTQNEDDSVHAVIEAKTMGKDIFSPQMWYDHIRTAKRSNVNPYDVIEVDQSMIFDLKTLIIGKNWATNTSGQKISWSKIRVFHTRSDDPGILYYKLNFNDNYSQLNTHANITIDVHNISKTLLPAYDSLLKITVLKHKDVMELCNNLSIPIQYHDYYKNIPVNTSEKEKESDQDIEDNPGEDITKDTLELECELIKAKQSRLEENKKKRANPEANQR